MTDPTNERGDGLEGLGGGTARGTRESSLTLRSSDQQAPVGNVLDPANQSLADALRITFKALILTIVLLAGAFVLSGFQSVREGERGISLLFGRVTAADLSPGFRFSFPFPFGELLRVRTSVPQLKLEDEFWPALTEQERRLTVEQLPVRATLNPVRDNSLVTADQAIAHARWTVVYRRDATEKYSRNILPTSEAAIVRAAVKRGVIHAVSTTSIDGLLQQASGGAGSVADRARRVAQQTLDRMESGILIEQLNLDEKMPPVAVRGVFAQVQSADADRSKNREQAMGAANEILNAVAGSAAPHLSRLIDDYEQALRNPTAEPGEADAILSKMTAMFEGREVEIDGVRIGSVVSGEVTAILAEAQRYRNNIASARRAEATAFAAKYEQFKANPLVVVHQEWSEALTAFLGRPNVQVMLLPPGTPLDRITMMLNLDPDFVSEQKRAMLEKRNAEVAEQRIRELEGQRFRTDTTRQETSQ